jgi:UDP-N-acetyl-2-amino-2-deoxyglucuronate dehydrogenase
MDATTHCHRLQIQDFLRAVREGRPPLVTGEDGRAVVELFTAIYRSNREGRPVMLGMGSSQLPPNDSIRPK